MRALNEHPYGRADSPRYKREKRVLNERPYGRADSPRYRRGSCSLISSPTLIPNP